MIRIFSVLFWLLLVLNVGGTTAAVVYRAHASQSTPAACSCPDFYAVAFFFGTYAGGPPGSNGQPYNPRYDLNHDGRINVVDMVLAARCAAEAR